ncbi:hypothetical protein [Trichocoleus sp. FACHB-262]|uniref:hypothetical protein n=1 Tax=Trichocoleus sp. FACHB-262 TaxID=2692869 RepID=UPI00168814D7|nr:hypothetical protein [Trichocoleus sp. FACHB-262]MBD2122523.1 hypothetical protein [Trichocoleus sp. FACHB-262]
MPRQRPRTSDRINLPRSKADEYFDSVEVRPDDQTTSQQVNQQESQQVVDDSHPTEPTISVSPSADNRKKQSNTQPISLPDNKSGSQQPKKLKKATFQLDETLLKELDTFHLKLQLELGKENAPYKEVLVEAAIAQLLEQYQQAPKETLDTLQTRQANRS